MPKASQRLLDDSAFDIEAWLAGRIAVNALADYSNPLSLVRLARLHGTGQVLRESLLASDDWQAVNQRFSHWGERPEFHLDA